MCHRPEAKPPDFPQDLAVPDLGIRAERITLTSSDRAPTWAAVAVAPASRGAAVVILPDVRGLHPFYVQLAAQFATAGHSAIAIDYFGRTSVEPTRRGVDFDFTAHIEALTLDQVQTDLAR